MKNKFRNGNAVIIISMKYDCSSIDTGRIKYKKLKWNRIEVGMSRVSEDTKWVAGNYLGGCVSSHKVTMPKSKNFYLQYKLPLHFSVHTSSFQNMGSCSLLSSVPGFFLCFFFVIAHLLASNLIWNSHSWFHTFFMSST